MCDDVNDVIQGPLTLVLDSELVLWLSGLALMSQVQVKTFPQVTDAPLTRCEPCVGGTGLDCDGGYLGQPRFYLGGLRVVWVEGQTTEAFELPL